MHSHLHRRQRRLRSGFVRQPFAQRGEIQDAAAFQVATVLVIILAAAPRGFAQPHGHRIAQRLPSVIEQPPSISGILEPQTATSREFGCAANTFCPLQVRRHHIRLHCLLWRGFLCRTQVHFTVRCGHTKRARPQLAFYPSRINPALHHLHARGRARSGTPPCSPKP